MQKEAGITSRYKAYPPDGGPFKVVKLGFRKKLEFEAKGWKFVRTTLPPQ